MYTFRRPQHQPLPQEPYAIGPEALDPDASHTVQPDHTAPPGAHTDGTQETYDPQPQSPQGFDGALSEDAPEADVLQYCRGMILRNQMNAPSHWRRVRTVLPASVAELHLTPSAPETIQQTHPITPSSCVVMQLDGCLPEGMTVKEYMKDLVKYVFDLLAYQRASTAITSLRFVKIGTELTQLVVTFGHDVQLATRMLEELATVGFTAGFGQSNEENAPNATFQITDYHFSMNNGKGITSDDISSLLEPTRPPLGVSVIEGYEPGVFYAAVKRPETVYAWLWNPFTSFVVQRTLFERFGVVLTMAACPHEFLTRGVSSTAQQQGKQRVRRRGEDGNMEFDEGLPEENEDEGDEEVAGAVVGADETAGEQRKSLAWSRNAEEEIDIFGGLDKSGAGGFSNRVDTLFLDKDITELLHSAKAEQQEQQQQQQQQEEYELYGEQQAYPSPYNTTDHLSLPQHTAYAQPPYHQSMYHTAQEGSWLQQPPPPPPQQQQQGNEEMWGHYGYVAPHYMPPQYTSSVSHAYPAPPNTESAMKYPELVDENDDESNNKNDMEAVEVNAMAVDAAPPPIQQNYWGGEYPPVAAYGGPVIFPSGMPSILGKPTYGMHYSNTSGAPGSRAILAMPPPPAVVQQKEETEVAVCTLTVEAAAQHTERLFELMQVAFPSMVDVSETELLNEEGNTDANEEGQKKEEEEKEEKKEDVEAEGEEAEMLEREANPLFSFVPVDAAAPRPSAEFVDLFLFLTAHSATLTALLESSAAELQEFRRRVALLLLAPCAASERDDWVLVDQDESESHVGEGCHAGHLPALLPYLLTSGEGTRMAAALATHHTARTLPLLTRYALPFILHPNVVQSVLTTALRADPSTENPLVRRIICHWGSLATWLQGHIHSQANADSEIDVHKTATGSVATRRLTSQVGNTMDVLLTAMSPEQRKFTRAHLEATDAVVEFSKSLNVPAGAGAGEEVKSELPTSSSQWGAEGAVHRSLLRLYLNANVISGAAVVKALFAPLPQLLREHYCFILVAISRSLVSPALSEETARLCGGFLRLMEERILNMTDNDAEEPKDDSGAASKAAAGSHTALTEKDAVHLVDAAMRVLKSDEVYQCLRDAYFETSSTATVPMRRFEKVEKKLSAPTPLVNLHQPKPSVSESGAILAPSTNTHAKQQHEHKSSDEKNNNNTNTGNAWRSEWTAQMRNYPPFGEPFTPLPTGWTSALSRSYGHYYFKDAAGTASYRHPIDATEFMATPQAFLQEPASGFSLDDVLSHMSETFGPEVVTREQAEAWLQDQRIRVEALDTAVLAVLKITYRSGGRKRSERNADDEQSRSIQTMHRCPLSPDKIQKKLSKLHTYPPRGHPFKPLPRHWTCNLSSSNGLYYFRPPHGSPVYQHPDNGREYRASPQAFVLHRQIHANAVAIEAQRSLQEVEEWMSDQRRRDEVLDATVVRMIPLSYVYSADYDDDIDDEKEQEEEVNRLSSDRRSSASRKKHSRR